MNKPKYSFIKNAKYALSGLKDMILTEKSFRIELVLFLILNFIVFVLPFKFNYKIILSLSLFIPLFSEIINSKFPIQIVTLGRLRVGRIGLRNSPFRG